MKWRSQISNNQYLLIRLSLPDIFQCRFPYFLSENVRNNPDGISSCALNHFTFFISKYFLCLVLKPFKRVQLNPFTFSTDLQFFDSPIQSSSVRVLVNLDIWSECLLISSTVICCFLYLLIIWNCFISSWLGTSEFVFFELFIFFS